ncbi:MAG: isoprenylcysteine carboxylmethyltransferase family protein [Deltaproteobacteria bacterium]|nr:isoprenylcysteine carboxylmethyltransferase family protein [Deltaproteobacteria bacterium]
MKRIGIFVYGVVSYAIFFVTFLYAVGFLGNVGVPKSIDSPREGSLGVALAVDLLLLAAFALQHSVMARPAFKKAWTRVVPPAAERSTYVLASSVALIALFAWWRPIGGVVWHLEGTFARGVAHTLLAAGFATVLVTTFLINHFDLFGLRQVWTHLRGRPYQPLAFRTSGPYAHVRHPLYVGWFLAFWATPAMTASHLVFAVATTAYILVAVLFEERDLVAEHGAAYERYRARVPRFFPRLAVGRAQRVDRAEAGAATELAA